MAQGDRTFKVVLEVVNGVLEENLSIVEEAAGGGMDPKHLKKLQKRETKRKYRDLMKDPSKFAQTDIAQPHHPTLIMRDPATPGAKTDEVSFYYFEGFTISFGPDPEIIEEGETAPDGPFTKGGAVITVDAATFVGGTAAERYRAGPYRVANNSKNQIFWKFSVTTQSGLTLDPCIITE